MKKALITGITGQDGSYLSEFLIKKEYEIHGIIRRSSSFNTGRIDHLINYENFYLHYGDVTDASNLNRLLERIAPDEIYNLAAQSHVKVSFEIPDYTAQVDALGTLRFMDAIREVGIDTNTRFYQASTSELFGKVQSIPQNENTPFYPRSPYAVAKLYGFWIVKNYREAYNLFACNGILFNHESPRRGETFVTRKITRAISRIILGLENELVLGNLDAQRDWGYAPEYCEGMWRILQAERADDYVLATGEAHSVREFVENSFQYLGIEIIWKGNGVNERAIINKINYDYLNNQLRLNEMNPFNFRINSVISQGSVIVKINPKYYRPTEVDFLLGDSTKARNELKWEPNIKFKELVQIMIKADIEKVIKRGY